MIKLFKFYAGRDEPFYHFAFKDGKLFYIKIIYFGKESCYYRYPSTFERPIQMQFFENAIDVALKDRTHRHFTEFIECLHNDIEYFNIAKKTNFRRNFLSIRKT